MRIFEIQEKFPYSEILKSFNGYTLITLKVQEIKMISSPDCLYSLGYFKYEKILLF